jgi:kynurenine formamidase
MDHPYDNIIQNATTNISHEWIDASILFIDIKDFSKQEETIQYDMYISLWDFVIQELNGHNIEDYILRSTGDGVLLIDIKGEVDLLVIAKNLQKKLGDKLQCRQGLNCGKVKPVNHGTDAIGYPINMCRRIVDCGGGHSNHILASYQYVETKIANKSVREDFHDLGEFEVKHGEILHIYNYYDENYGNPEFPGSIRLLYPKVKSFFVNGSWTSFLDCCEIIDLSHELVMNRSCCYSTNPDNTIHPGHYTGQSRGVTFLTTRLDNFYLNYGTHIDFPGHLIGEGKNRSIGSYELTRFISEAIIVDVRDKLKGINQLIDAKERIKWGNEKDGKNNLISIIDNMEISLSYFRGKVTQDLRGKSVIFCTGLDRYWKYGVCAPWDYPYFFNPYPSPELAEFLAQSGVSLIGIDALQIESPLINFEEPPSFLSSKHKKDFKKKLVEIEKNFAHRIFLDRDVCIAENLTQVTKIIGERVLFVIAPLKLGFVTDNSISRAFALILKDRSGDSHDRSVLD